MPLFTSAQTFSTIQYYNDFCQQNLGNNWRFFLMKPQLILTQALWSITQQNLTSMFEENQITEEHRWTSVMEKVPSVHDYMWHWTCQCDNASTLMNVRVFSGVQIIRQNFRLKISCIMCVCQVCMSSTPTIKNVYFSIR